MLASCLAHPAAAQMHMVDQETQPTVNFNAVSANLSPMGQEFVPTVADMNAVELWIGSFNVGTTDLQVHIHEGSINGAVNIVASSVVTIAPVNHNGPLLFDFPSLVTLTPGTKYVIEPVSVSGVAYVLSGRNVDSYPDGIAIMGHPGDDAF